MIKVLHLYYDLLNLYGEQGNILALKRAFKNQNIDIEVDYLSVQDKNRILSITKRYKTKSRKFI